MMVFAVLFHYNGVKYVNDSHRYIEYAESLKNGFYIEAHNIWYFGYVIFIYLINIFAGKSQYLIIVMAQYLLCYFALILLYKSVVLLFKNRLSGLLAGFLFIAQIEIISWSSYLLCESLYISMICFSLWAGISWFQGKRSWRMLLLMLFLFLFTFISKPTGIALLVGIGALLVREFWRRLNNRWIKAICLAASLISLLLLVNLMLSTFTLMRDYQSGEIIFAINTVPYQPSFKYLIVEVPQHLNILSDHYPPLVRLVHFIASNFNYWIKISSIKVFYFILHIRPYWSLWHNLYSLILLLPLYLFCIKALFNKLLPVEVRLFSITYIVIHTLTVGMTTVDWDGRFLMPVLPVIFILSSYQIIVQLQGRCSWLNYQ
ncbi:hypothetical protein JL102_15855 [Fulvivirga sp. 2943]|uniref:Uncharacterized protein n=1 Tax=Fulvivirga sediminis TaxID=2803949 RepID=A0A937K0G4_9BACT|nr:hypothetical protein [Fulvivirga sediminis]